MDNLGFDSIGETEASSLEREFEEDKVQEALFKMSREKALGLDGF